MSEEKFNIEELNKAFADLKIKTGGLPLLRGLRISNNRERKLPHPENRPPLGSSGSFTLMYNSVIDAGFKIPNIRSHSIFADNIHLKSAIEYHNEILIYESDGYFIKPYENI